MNKLLFLLLCLISFSAFSNPVFNGHHVIVENNGQTRLGGYSSTKSMLEARHFVADNKSTAQWFNRNFQNLNVVTQQGAVSNSALKTTVSHSIEKKAVSAAVFGNMKVAAKFAARGVPYAGWALVAYELYDADLKASGVEYDLDSDQYGVRVASNQYSAVAISNKIHGSATMNSLSTSYTFLDMQNLCENRGYQCSFSLGVSSNPNTFAENAADFCGQYFSKVNSNGACGYSGAPAGWVQPSKSILIFKVKESVKPLTNEDFHARMLPVFDGDPSSAVNASRATQNSSPPSIAYIGISASAGDSVKTDVYTDPRDGRAKETKITINTDGKTATIEDTLRPDLQNDTELAPVPTPLPENNIDNETKPDPSPASTPLQCDSDKYPDSLGCVDTTEEIEDASMVIPQETVPLDFQVKNYITSSTGTCPQGSQFTLNFSSTHTYEFSFEPVCKFAEMIKYALWVCSWLIAYYIVIGRPE